MTPKPDVMFTETEIRDRVVELGRAVAAAFDGNEICVVGLMKGCLVFTADLIRAIPLDMTCHFVRTTALQGDERAVRTDIVYATEIPYRGRHILLIDDIVDTGVTLNFVCDHILAEQPASLKVIALIDKPGVRKVDVNPDWAAFTLENPVEDRFLVGYGLDFAERYRGLPYIGTIPRPGPAPAERTLDLSKGE